MIHAALSAHLKLPVIAAPMFLVSRPELVIATCKAGMIGTFPALNQRDSEGYDAWLTDIRSALGPEAPAFGVNLIVHPTNARLEADLEITVRHKVPLVITSLGTVRKVIDTVHSYGGLVFHDVISRRHAEKAAEAGADGLILVCAGAGGHAGTLNPFAFTEEVRRFYKGTIVLSGGISTGGDIAAAISAGADLAYMGTRFIATAEAAADDAYKAMITESGTSDIVYTDAVSGINANFLIPSLIANGLDPKAARDPAHRIDVAHELNPEARAWKTVWSAGHGVGAIDDTPSVAMLSDRLRSEFAAASQRLEQTVHRFGL